MKLTVAPAVWLVHFTAVYVVASIACARLPAATLAATAVALVLYAGAALLEARRRHDAGNGTAAFVSRTQVLLCVLAAVGTLWVAYPAFVLPPCAA